MFTNSPCAHFRVGFIYRQNTSKHRNRLNKIVRIVRKVVEGLGPFTYDTRLV